MLRRRSVLALLAVYLAPLAAPLLAASWVPLGPEGGSVRALVVDPSDPRVVYAAAAENGIFKSLDGGKTWRLLPGSLGLRDYPYKEILIHPAEPENVYALTSPSGIFKSADAGETWGEEPVVPQRAGRSGRDLALDPSDPSHLLAATLEGPFESFDGGAIWQPVADFPLDPDSVRASTGSVAIDPTDPDILYVTTWPFGVLKSTDGGASWAEANQGLDPTTDSATLVIAPSASSRLYLANSESQGLYFSTNGAASWQRLEPGLQGVLTHLEVDRLDPERLFAVVYRKGLFRSVDGGRNWTRIDDGITGAVHAFAADPDDPQVLHAGSDEGAWRSMDGGATWRLQIEGLTARRLRSLAAVAGATPAVFTGSGGGRSCVAGWGTATGAACTTPALSSGTWQ
jgi:photosystem II stability/assembly factor-like uncharacterized protein